MEKLIKGLREFQTTQFSKYQDLFEQLAQGQKPRILFITCSDSRVDPNLITNAQVGDLFVIRNAGNIIPSHGSANGGEGATIEYAMEALDIQQIIVCGHSHCGAMKGLLKIDQLRDKMPLVCQWLQHTEATRRLIKDNYSHLQGESLLDVAIAENVLTQIENLRTYPSIHAKLRQGRLSLHAWVYHIESAEVFAYDANTHEYILPAATPQPLDPEELLAPYYHKPMGWLAPQQAERIYRGSQRKSS
ncbi:MAG: carbonic anhydrase [Chloroflexaceae bacterium]|nr:carbonic anhydrase [Chloroflexaceae bacterium]